MAYLDTFHGVEEDKHVNLQFVQKMFDGDKHYIQEGQHDTPFPTIELYIIDTSMVYQKTMRHREQIKLTE